MLCHVGYDDRGWVLLDAVSNSPEVNVFAIAVKGKPLELLLHPAEPIRVYVNPELTGLDEWEKPPGSGNIFQVGTPLEELERHGIRVPAIPKAAPKAAVPKAVARRERQRLRLQERLQLQRQLQRQRQLH